MIAANVAFRFNFEKWRSHLLMPWLHVNPNFDFSTILHFFGTLSASFHQEIIFFQHFFFEKLF